jgi:enoyl-CoA hydratase
MLDETLNSGLRIKDDENGIGWITLDRPRYSNAINPELATDLSQFIAVLSARPRVRVIILQGSGKNFCAGFDLNRIGDVTGGFERGLRIQRLMSGIIAQMRRIPQPIIAAVQGAASGAGFALALAADVRFVAPDTRMNVAMARIGLTGCDMGISYFLPRLVGRSVAAELMMTGNFIDAVRAERLGLVSAIVATEDLQRHTLELAGQMLRMSPGGLQLTKEGLDAAQDATSLEQVLALEDRGQLICIRQYMAEGVAAFREKRPPNYSAIDGA